MSLGQAQHFIGSVWAPRAPGSLRFEHFRQQAARARGRGIPGRHRRHQAARLHVPQITPTLVEDTNYRVAGAADPLRGIAVLFYEFGGIVFPRCLLAQFEQR